MRTLLITLALALAPGLSGCGDDNAAAPGPLDGAVLEVTKTEHWRDDFGSLALYYNAFGPNEVGPSLSQANATLTITWDKAAYQDCGNPTGARIARAGLDLTVTFESVGSKQPCDYKDVVADVTTVFALAPAGSYKVTVESTLFPYNKGVQNAGPTTFDVTVP